MTDRLQLVSVAHIWRQCMLQLLEEVELNREAAGVQRGQEKEDVISVSICGGWHKTRWETHLSLTFTFLCFMSRMCVFMWSDGRLNPDKMVCVWKVNEREKCVKAAHFTVALKIIHPPFQIRCIAESTLLLLCYQLQTWCIWRTPASDSETFSI